MVPDPKLPPLKVAQVTISSGMMKKPFKWIWKEKRARVKEHPPENAGG